MPRCRLHVFPPETEGDGVQTLREAFETRFTPSDASVQDHAEEWVSEPFDDTSESLDRIDAFEDRCLELFPEADVLRTEQKRDAMDGQATEHDYELAIMLNVTDAIS